MLTPVFIRRLYQQVGPATLLVLLSIGVACAASLTLFTAAYDGATVRVVWEVNTEADVTGFELARKAAAETTFSTVSTVVPTGQRRYQYNDANVYRTTATGIGTAPNAGGPFTYRLTIRGASADQNYTTVVAGTPSAVLRSWGTIKSMFR